MIDPPIEVEVSLDRDDYFFRVLKDKDAKKAINGTRLDASYFNLGETYEVWKLLKNGEVIYFWGGCKEISEVSTTGRGDWEVVVLFDVLGEPQRGKENESEETEVKKQELIKIIKSLARETSQNYPHEEMVELPDVLNAIAQLDEPEVLSQGWIRANQERKGTHFYVRVNKLQNLLVPKQEEPTQEQVQKYNVKFKVKSSFGTVGIFLYKEGDEVLAGNNFRAYYPEEDECRLTEQEIRDFQNGDVLFEHFAVKVEELEE